MWPHELHTERILSFLAREVDFGKKHLEGTLGTGVSCLLTTAVHSSISNPGNLFKIYGLKIYLLNQTLRAQGPGNCVLIKNSGDFIVHGNSEGHCLKD